MIWIVTDSAQELKTNKEEGLVVMDLPLFKNGETATGLSREQFYQDLAKDDVAMTTSQASPAAFEELFRQLTENGDSVVYVSLSSTLSGTFNSARLAAMEMEDVHLVDTLEASLSQSAMVMRALQLRDEGKTAQEIADCLNKEKEDCCLFASLATLKYLKKGGRISPAAAAIGELAAIKPIITVDESGQVKVAAKTRGIKKSLRQTAQLAIDTGIDLSRPVVIGYSGLDDSNAKELAALLEDLCGFQYQGEYLALSPVLSVHAGPDAAGIAFFRQK